MSIGYKIYLAAWISLCAIAVLIYANDRHAFAFSQRHYFEFLFTRWKIATFLCATIGIAAVAPYTGDPTWDYVDATLMAILTFFSAPWAIGAIYLVAKRRLSAKQGFVALCAWLLSASWCYDLYLTIRDGSYPITWAANIAASSVLYVSAGLFWNLEWKAGRGVTFSFLENEWPKQAADKRFEKIIWYAVPFMLIVGCAIEYFLL